MTNDNNDITKAGAAEINAFNSNLITEFRANDGKVSGMFAGAPLLLLTHTGAKSGARRTTPLVHTRDGERYVIIASDRKSVV